MIKELKEKIKKLESEVELEHSETLIKRKTLQELKMKLAENTKSDLIGKCFKQLVKQTDKTYEDDYWSYIKILGLRDDRQVYIDSFSVNTIKYKEPKTQFVFVVNENLYMQFLGKFGYKEITEEEYNQALKENLERVGICMNKSPCQKCGLPEDICVCEEIMKEVGIK